MPPTLMWQCCVACCSHTGQRKVFTGPWCTTCTAWDKSWKRDLSACLNRLSHLCLAHAAAPWWPRRLHWSTLTKPRQEDCSHTGLMLFWDCGQDVFIKSLWCPRWFKWPMSSAVFSGYESEMQWRGQISEHRDLCKGVSDQPPSTGRSWPRLWSGHEHL